MCYGMHLVEYAILYQSVYPAYSNVRFKSQVAQLRVKIICFLKNWSELPPFTLQAIKFMIYTL